MRYRLFIFDFDGTLSDSFSWFTGTLNTVADQFRFRKVKPNEIESLRRLPPREIMRHLGIPFWKMPLIAWRMRALMARDLRRISLFEGVHELIQVLHGRGATLALVTSNSRQNVCRLLGPESAARIHHYECSSSLFGKRARFRRVLRRSRIPATEAICIGDEIRDLEAARREGIDFGAVSWGYGEVEMLRAAAPTEVFASLGDIAERLA